MTWVAIAFVSLLLGCKTPQEELVGKPPEKGAAVEQPAAPKPPAAQPGHRFPDPRLVIESWPYAEIGTTFVLTWGGSSKPAPLHEAPNPNSRLIGDVVWERGERILWSETVVASYRPRVVRATAEWFVEGPVYRAGYLVDQEFVQVELAKGESLEVWAYAGDLQCYMARRGEIFTGPCPTPDRFKGLGNGKIPAEWYMPEHKIWWIRIAANNVSGWVPVDDRMIVDIVNE